MMLPSAVRAQPCVADTATCEKDPGGGGWVTFGIPPKQDKLLFGRMTQAYDGVLAICCAADGCRTAHSITHAVHTATPTMEKVAVHLVRPYVAVMEARASSTVCQLRDGMSRSTLAG